MSSSQYGAKNYFSTSQLVTACNYIVYNYKVGELSVE